jgi:hypothetical protein
MAASQHSTLREARAQYLRENGLDEDGGYARNWVTIKLGPVPLMFLNTNARRAVLLQHDLHHVATGYDTTLVWRGRDRGLGACQRVPALLRGVDPQSGAVLTGLVLAPRRVGRAFMRGRRSTNLYHLGLDARWPEEAVGRLREKLRLPSSSLT